MKNLLRLLFPTFLCLIFPQGTTAQTSPLLIRASTMNLYVSDPDMFSYSADNPSHTLHPGDRIDAVDADGSRMTFSIQKLQIDYIPVDSVTVGQYFSMDLKLLAGSTRDFGGDFFFVDEGASLPQGLSQPLAPAPVSVLLGTDHWLAAPGPNGALFYQGGLRIMDPSQKPFLQLAFSTANGADNRNFTLQIRDFQPKKGKIDPSHSEVLITGAGPSDPQNTKLFGYKNNDDYRGYSFSFEITEWKQTSPESAILSAKFSGKLKGIFGSPDLPITNGKIEGITVTIHRAPY